MSVRALAAVNSVVLLAALLTAAVGVEAGLGVPAAEAGATSVVSSAPPAAVEPVPATPAPPSPSPSPAPSPATSPAPASSPAPAPAPTTPAPPAPAPRTTTVTGWQPYATAGPVVLHSPGDVVEAIGFHQSGHDGAQPQQPAPGSVRSGLLEQRGRDTHPQGAADIVVDPAREVRSPVTGTVLRAGTYTLYCDHVDQYLVVEPDARPGWEVKLLHFQGLRVAAGSRVEAGVTVIGSGARVLPFRSQVDDHTAAPHWPHLHVEVVDPSVPDRPSGGGC